MVGAFDPGIMTLFKIRLFSTFKILKNCCKIRKKTLTVWKFQTIKVILYSNLQIML